MSFLIWINVCYVLMLSFLCAAGVMNVREPLMSFSTLNISFNFSFLCYSWSSFHSHGSYVHKVFTLFWLHIVYFCFFLGLYLLVLSFALYFWWMGLMDGFQALIFIYRIFLLVFFLCAQRKTPTIHWMPLFSQVWMNLNWVNI